MTAQLVYGSRQGRAVLLATVLASGAAFLDATVVVVALPRMGTDLGAGFSELQWVLDAYLLTLGSLVLVGGAMGDVLGRRPVFLVGLVGFGLASAACALAPTATVLIGARALQGVFAALMTPISLAILSASFDPVDRLRAIGAWAGLSGVATAVGPFLGGWLTDVASWRWVFWINLPVVAAGLAVAHGAVPAEPGAAEGLSRRAALNRIDIPGGLLTVVGLALVVTPLIEVARLPTTAVVAGVVTGVALLFVFIWYETRRSHPMLPPGLFRIRTFSVANLITLVVYGALSAQGFLLSLTLQRTMGYSALAAGAAMIPVTALLLLFSSRTGLLVRRFGARALLTVGPLLAALGMVLLAQVGPGDRYWTGVLPGVTVFGAGLVLVVAPVTSTALADVPQDRQGVASGTNNAIARIAGLLAVAALPVAAGLSSAAQLDPAALVGGYQQAMLIAAVACAAGGLIAWAGLDAHTGRVLEAPGATR